MQIKSSQRKSHEMMTRIIRDMQFTREKKNNGKRHGKRIFYRLLGYTWKANEYLNLGMFVESATRRSEMDREEAGERQWTSEIASKSVLDGERKRHTATETGRERESEFAVCVRVFKVKNQTNKDLTLTVQLPQTVSKRNFACVLYI